MLFCNKSSIIEVSVHLHFTWCHNWIQQLWDDQWSRVWEQIPIYLPTLVCCDLFLEFENISTSLATLCCNMVFHFICYCFCLLAICKCCQHTCIVPSAQTVDLGWFHKCSNRLDCRHLLNVLFLDRGYLIPLVSQFSLHWSLMITWLLISLYWLVKRMNKMSIESWKRRGLVGL